MGARVRENTYGFVACVSEFTAAGLAVVIGALALAAVGIGFAGLGTNVTNAASSA